MWEQLAWLFAGLLHSFVLLSFGMHKISLSPFFRPRRCLTWGKSPESHYRREFKPSNLGACDSNSVLWYSWFVTNDWGVITNHESLKLNQKSRMVSTSVVLSERRHIKMWSYLSLLCLWHLSPPLAALLANQRRFPAFVYAQNRIGWRAPWTC